MIVSIPNCRLAFAQIFEAKTFQGEGDPAYTAMLILNPKSNAETIKTVKESMIAVAKEKWAAKADNVIKSLAGTDKVCLRNGDSKADWGGFEGNMFISTRSKTKPLVLDRDKTPLTAADGRPYSGCYVNASIEIWAQDNGYGKRINASLRGIQFFKDGDAFAGGAPADADEFDAVTDFGSDEGDAASLL